MKKALIYIRVSTEEQATSDRHSLKTQVELCKRAIPEMGYELAENGVYEDAGRSATNMNRPGLQDMLIRIEEDKSIGAVFVQDTDRLARNANDHLLIKTLLKKHSAILVSVSQPGLEDTPEGNFMDLIIAGVNQLQSQITARKTMKSMEQKFNSGGWPTKAPFGYLNAVEPDDEKKRIIIVDEERSPFACEAFRLYATGDYSIAEIRDLLYQRGMRSLGGKMIAHSKLNELLKNPLYYGEMHWNGLNKKGNHTPLIKKILFDRCQRIMAEHNRYLCRRRKHDFLLRGFVFCELDGQRHTAEHHPTKGKSYYHCSRSNNRAKCSDRYVETYELEDQVQVKFNEMQFSEEFIRKIEERVRYIYEKKKKSVGSEKKQLMTTKVNLEIKLEAAEEKLLSGILSDEGFERAKKRYREQINAIDNEIIKLDRSKNLKVDVIQQILGLARNISESYENAKPELKRLYLGLFWERFTVADRRIVQAIKSPIVQALEAAGTLKFADVKKPLLSPGLSTSGEEVLLRNERGAYRESNPS